MRLWIGCIGFGLTGCYTAFVRPADNAGMNREMDWRDRHIRETASYYEPSYKPLFRLSNTREEMSDVPKERIATRESVDNGAIRVATQPIAILGSADTARSASRQEVNQESLSSDGRRRFGPRTSIKVKRD